MSQYQTFGFNVTQQGTAIKKSYSTPTTVQFYNLDLPIDTRLPLIEKDMHLHDLESDLKRDYAKLANVVADLEVKLGVRQGTLTKEELYRILMTVGISHQNFHKIAHQYPQGKLDMQFAKKLKSYNTLTQRIEHHTNRVKEILRWKSENPYPSYILAGNVMHKAEHQVQGTVAYQFAGMVSYTVANTLGTANMGVALCPHCFK